MKNRILVVDDEEHVRVAFQTFLEEEGYEVVVAEDYDSAIRALESSRLDVVVSDIIMGQKTGIDLLREIKGKGLRCPVVMITGAPDIETATSAVRLGAFDYMSKPVTQEILLKAVALALRHKTLDDERERYHRNLEAIFASVQDGVVSVDDAMVITHANEAIEYYFRFSPEQLPGKTIQEAVKPSFSSCIEVLEKTIQTREPVREFRTEATDNDGRQMVVVINCSPLIDRDGTFMGSVLVLRDISRITNLERELQERQSFQKIIGKSIIMQDIYTRIEALAETDTTVLITGSSGTGKELVAEAIHYSGSRALKPLVKFNCTAFAENLLESELFGHVAGAFTGAIKDKTGRFQMAHEGTIFLDEIGDMAPSLQLKLLRVLQEHEFERVGDTRPIKVDIRVIAATNCDLLEKMRLGTFREDLYYRLNVMEMNLPSLVQRIEDIPLLVSHFCAGFSRKFKKDVKGVSAQVMRLFVNYQWPGNVRELENVLERAFILCNADTITTDHISLQLKDASGLENGAEEPECALDSDQILHALKQTRWNRSKAAELLGISRRTFYRKLKDLHLLEAK